jgi:transaldolase
MKIFVDSADLQEIEKYLSWGICDGVTTNPSIAIKCGVKSFAELKERSIAIAGLIAPRPLSVEVTTNDRDEMLQQAREYVGWAPNVNVKITITTREGESCLPVIRQLAAEDIDVNVTAMMTFNQAILAAKAGGKYLSLFGGRIDDEGNDAIEVIGATREWLDLWGDTLPRQPEIIVGSTRTVRNITDWAGVGAHIITVPPDVLGKMLVNARTKETVAQFLDDADKALKALGG